MRAHKDLWQLPQSSQNTVKPHTGKLVRVLLPEVFGDSLFVDGNA